MSIQLRIALPDRPGALARVAQAIARVGADVMAVSVIESEAGRAVDDLWLRWPDGRSTDWLVSSVEGCAGVDVIACRHTRWVRGARPELDLMTCLLAAPERGVETLVDMAPTVLDADWAELRAPARRLAALYGTAAAYRDDLAPETMPIRPLGKQSADWACAYLPVQSLRSVLVVGRDGGPPFLRSELVTAERLLDVALMLLDGVLQHRPRRAEASELTAHLLLAKGA